MKKYDTYKPSGVEWLGDIPIHWVVKKLGFLGEFSASGIDKYIKANESKVKIINFTDVYGNLNKIIDSNFKLMEVTTPEANRIKHLVKKGDMIFLPSSETYEDLGLSALVNENLENTSFSYHVIKLRLNENVSHSFRKYFTNNETILNQFAKAGKGTTRKIIGRNVFKNILVILPPLSEQEKIAQFLDDKTTKIDKAISIKQQQIELLKERRQILIHQAVTKGINPNVKLKDSGVEWIGEIPEGWEVVPIRRLIDVRDGTHDTPQYVEDSENSYPLVTSKDFEGEKINFENIKKISERDHLNISKRSGVKKGDVLMSMIGGNIGKSLIIGDTDNFSIKNVALFRTNKDLTIAKFLIYYFESSLLQKQIELKSRGGAQGFMSLGDIRNLFFFKLNDSELVEIVNYLDNTTTKIATSISLKEQEIEKLKEYKSSLINDVVTGEVMVD